MNRAAAIGIAYLLFPFALVGLFVSAQFIARQLRRMRYERRVIEAKPSSDPRRAQDAHRRILSGR